MRYSFSCASRFSIHNSSIHINSISSFLFDIAQVLFNLQPPLASIYSGIRYDTMAFSFFFFFFASIFFFIFLSFNVSAIEYWCFDACDMCVHIVYYPTYNIFADILRQVFLLNKIFAIHHHSQAQTIPYACMNRIVNKIHTTYMSFLIGSNRTAKWNCTLIRKENWK